ncbi:hypothetical protein T484DRAFT_1829243, partial [Baffinella frigidus]
MSCLRARFNKVGFSLWQVLPGSLALTFAFADSPPSSPTADPTGPASGHKNTSNGPASGQKTTSNGPASGRNSEDGPASEPPGGARLGSGSNGSKGYEGVARRFLRMVEDRGSMLFARGCSLENARAAVQVPTAQKGERVVRVLIQEDFDLLLFTPPSPTPHFPAEKRGNPPAPLPLSPPPPPPAPAPAPPHSSPSPHAAPVRSPEGAALSLPGALSLPRWPPSALAGAREGGAGARGAGGGTAGEAGF